jgi:glycogen(starch) synthase|tara:strand:- start:14282 stop:16132 length:1851 start_codon:yes stop_codon:yes gene_type:complete
MKTIKPKADFLIEVLHEVANPIGGVYTVATTSSGEMRRYYGENFYVVGAYYPKFAKVEFDEEIPPPEIKKIFEELEKEKITCYYGRWLITGKPKTILVDYSKWMKKLKKIKKEVTKKYGIDCSRCGPNLNRQIVWSYCLVKLFDKLLSLSGFQNKKGIAHFHLSDPGLLLLELAAKNTKLGIVYTAHSTRLGRFIAMNSEDLVTEIKEGIKHKKTVRKGREYKYGGIRVTVHQFEKACAKAADVFTSVSETTAREAEYILGKKTDVITPNGLEFERFVSLEERAIKHNNAKERIYRFLNAYFLPYYHVDIPHSLLFFTSGRYELTTKGYDILFKVLGKLNSILKKERYENNIFVFLFIMTDLKSSNEDILNNLSIYDTIEHTTQEELPNIEKRIIANLIHGHEIAKEKIFDEHFLMETKKLMLKFMRKEDETPPISAFKGLKKDDIIMKLLLKSGLDNKKEDIVKVIFYPAPVSIADGLLSMEYHEVVSGMHLGIFPSIYEPWGYTPLETAAQAVMSITSDVSGFGKFVMKNSNQRKKPGILVLKTENKKREEIVDELTDMMYWIAKLPRKQRIEKKLQARKLSTLADWGEFSKYYIQAHNLAIERAAKRQKSKKR